MKTKAAVLGGKNKVYLREYELPTIEDEELLVKVISNSVCLSTYKAAFLGRRASWSRQMCPITCDYRA